MYVSSSTSEVDLSYLGRSVSFYYIEYLPPTFARLLKSVKLDTAVKQLGFDDVKFRDPLRDP